jgi:hypothetical protein
MNLEEKDDGRLIFELEGIPYKKNLFKKQRSYIAVYEDYMYIELAGEKDYIDLESIFNIYIKEPVTKEVTNRTTVVEFYDEGENNYYELEDITFDGLAEKMEHLIANQWRQFSEKKKAPGAVKWFNACCALVYLSNAQDPELFGGAVKNPETAQTTREELYQSWRFKNSNDFRRMLPELLEGRSVKQYVKALEDFDAMDKSTRQLLSTIRQTCGTKSIWAWDLCRLILLCSLGYVADYISYDDALEWCGKAGDKLQHIYTDWDSMVESYLYGYCFWSEEDLSDPSTEAGERASIYQTLKGTPGNPFAIDWRTPLL